MVGGGWYLNQSLFLRIFISLMLSDSHGLPQSLTNVPSLLLDPVHGPVILIMWPCSWTHLSHGSRPIYDIMWMLLIDELVYNTLFGLDCSAAQYNYLIILWHYQKSYYVTQLCITMQCSIWHYSTLNVFQLMTRARVKRKRLNHRRKRRKKTRCS